MLQLRIPLYYSYVYYFTTALHTTLIHLRILIYYRYSYYFTTGRRELQAQIAAHREREEEVETDSIPNLLLIRYLLHYRSQSYRHRLRRIESGRRRWRRTAGAQFS